MKKLFLSLVMIAFAVGLSGSYSTPKVKIEDLKLASFIEKTIFSSERVEKEFKVKSGQKLTIDLQTGGEIRIESWEKEMVKVTAIFGGRDAEDIDLEFDESPLGILITTDYYGRNNNRSSNIRFEIMVPKKFDVDFETMGGDIRINGVEGELEGTTMGGELELNNLKGYVSMTTMGGAITLSDSEVEGKVKTMGGSVTLENIVGDVDASSMGGKVTQKNVKGKKGTIGKELHMSTMGGAITVDDAPNGAYLKTMGGSIEVKSAGIFVEAETMGGGIDIDAIDGWIKAKTMGGDVRVTMVGDPKKGERDVTLTSMGGDIELAVPDGLDMEIDIEIAFTKKYEGDVEIYSDYKIEKEISKEWEYDHGSKRKYLTGTGKVGSGKNKIKIRTINGNVYINKSK
ncbi:MAG: hypothetical protein A2V66_06190 [Ignavibacteria bacterium RBG_13_36_8]|nr:MAG: hypothetical protein A2V66_06190 [Ignavibacteria bacterium RBG_13_36_8]